MQRDPTECPDYDEFMAARLRRSQYNSKLFHHPDPRDPDYPGHDHEDEDDE